MAALSSCTDTLTDSASDAGARAAKAGDGGEAPGDAGASGTTPIATVGGASNGGGAQTEALAGDGGMAGIVQPMGTGGLAPSDAAAGAAGADVDQVAIPPGATVSVPATGGLTAIAFSPLTLTPAFSPLIHDYYVRCVAGANALTLTIGDDRGARAGAVTLYPDQALVVGDSYWVRCLPPDFPIVSVVQPGTPTPGYYLLNSFSYGAVFDVHGVPVWYVRGTQPLNIDSPATNTLSFMRDGQPTATTTPSYFIRDLASGDTKTVTSPDGTTDDHEMRILDNGDYLIFSAPVESGIDLTGLAAYGADERISDCEIEELDASGSIVWTWLASDHVDPKRESVLQLNVADAAGSYADVFHCNAIDVDSRGNLLVSMRNASAAFYIERATGTVLWKLGGTAYNKDAAALIRTKDDPQSDFSLQHDARLHENGDVTLFDDHGVGTGVARGVEYALDHDANTATPVFQYLGAGASLFEGSFRRYADGESVIGWGYIPGDLRALSEVDSAGKNVFDISFSGQGSQSYRAIKVPLSQLDIGLLRQDAAH